jgi:hypothetical protein
VHIAGAEVVPFVEAREVELELLDELDKPTVADADVVEFAETLVDAEEEILLADPELADVEVALLKVVSRLVEVVAVESTLELDFEFVSMLSDDENDKVGVDKDNEKVDDIKEEFTRFVSSAPTS